MEFHSRLAWNSGFERKLEGHSDAQPSRERNQQASGNGEHHSNMESDRIEFEGAHSYSKVTSITFYLRDQASTEIVYCYDVFPKNIGESSNLRGEGMQKFKLSRNGQSFKLSGTHFSSKMREGFLEMFGPAYATEIIDSPVLHSGAKQQA